MKKKSDEENFDEAYAQVFKAYQKTTVRDRPAMRLKPVVLTPA